MDVHTSADRRALSGGWEKRKYSSVAYEVLSVQVRLWKRVVFMNHRPSAATNVRQTQKTPFHCFFSLKGIQVLFKGSTLLAATPSWFSTNGKFEFRLIGIYCIKNLQEVHSARRASMMKSYS